MKHAPATVLTIITSPDYTRAFGLDPEVMGTDIAEGLLWTFAKHKVTDNAQERLLALRGYSIYFFVDDSSAVMYLAKKFCGVK